MTDIRNEDAMSISRTGMADRFSRAGDVVAYICNWISACAMVIIVAVNGINVVGRYVFSAPLSWAEELMLYLMILTVFSGAATVTWRQSHIRIEAIVQHLPMRARRLASIAVGILGIGLLLVIVINSLDVVQLLYSFGQHSDALEAPMWIPQGFLTLGLVLIAGLIALRLCIPAPEPKSHLGES